MSEDFSNAPEEKVLNVPVTDTANMPAVVIASKNPMPIRNPFAMSFINNANHSLALCCIIFIPFMLFSFIYKLFLIPKYVVVSPASVRNKKMLVA
jgi:hypothetical protein